MTKTEFKELAKVFCLNDLRYSGKRKTMFVNGDETTVSRFFSFLRNTHCLTFNLAGSNGETYSTGTGK